MTNVAVSAHQPIAVCARGAVLTLSFYLLFLAAPTALLLIGSGVRAFSWESLAVGAVAAGLAGTALLAIKRLARRSNSPLIAVGVVLGTVGWFASFVALLLAAWYSADVLLLGLLFPLPGALLLAGGTT